MAKHVLSVAPTEYPITLTELKYHLKWDDAADSDTYDADTHLTQLIKDATAIAEAESWKRFCTQTRIDYLDCFPTWIDLIAQPVASITSITYYDPSETLQTLSTDVYELCTVKGRGAVRLKYGQTWPTTLDHDDVVIVTYTCGTAAASVPYPDKRAVAMLATMLATNRGEKEFKIPRAVSELLSINTYRTFA